MNEKRSVILKDILWYFIGNMAPLIVGIIKSPIFTRRFSTEDFGAYSLVFLVFTYLSVVCYSWITSCVFRYYFRYKSENKISDLYSNLTFLYVLFSIVIFLVSIVWYGFSDIPLIRNLILLCFLQFFSSEILSLFFVRPRFEGRTVYYNIMQTVRAIGGFGLLIYFTFVLNYGIEAFLISGIILNVLLIGVVVIPDCFKMHLSFRLVKKEELIIFFKYGRIGLVTSLCAALLVSSDRFLIQYFCDLSDVGIYNQNYNIAQFSILILVQTYWAAINPYLLSLLEFRPENMKLQLYEYFKIYFFCFLPIVVYFFIYAKEIAEIMLGESFRVGYSVIAWAGMAEFIAGLFALSVLSLKFKDKFKLVAVTYTIGILVNVLLNIIFIPLMGYKVAAITTVIANCILLWIFAGKDEDTQVFSFLFRSKELMACLLLLASQLIIHFIFRHYSFPVYFYIAEGVVFCTAYFMIALKYKWINLDKINLS